MTGQAHKRHLILLTSPESPRPKTWESGGKLSPKKVDAFTLARMVVEHPGFKGTAA